MLSKLSVSVSSLQSAPPGLSNPLDLQQQMNDHHIEIMNAVAIVADAISSLRERVNKLETPPQPPMEKTIAATNLQHRVESMELLLFQTSPEDFKKIDKFIALSHTEDIPEAAEPEKESSPEKIPPHHSLGITTAYPHDEFDEMSPSCINFEIYSEAEGAHEDAGSARVTVGTQTSYNKPNRKGRVNGRAVQTESTSRTLQQTPAPMCRRMKKQC